MVSDGASNEETLEQIYETFADATNEGFSVHKLVIAMYGVGTGG